MPEKINWEIKSRKKVLTQEYSDMVLRLKPGEVVAFGEADFGGRDPFSFRSALIMHFRSKKIAIKTSVVEGRVLVALRTPEDEKKAAEIVEAQEVENETYTDSEGYLRYKSTGEYVK